ncbi:YcdB/YcdC domain-containing protein [Bacillus cihuensis]|uniref:YcdB/YcdC domain-containing protein n=1 Tax=Bacillus cihuensis TaxID=1208599 RepID=UPI0004175F59|nr:YcdB/YcdC domain-containing protein [Bacillus cihuensis]
MNKERLKLRALQIGKVSNDFELEIEDFSEEHQVALFVWKSIHDAEQGIWIELDSEGHLLHYNQYEAVLHHLLLQEEELLEKSLQFVSQYYPDALKTFVPEKSKTLSNGMRFSSVQMELGLPLEMTGFYVDVAFSGDILAFRYYGEAKDIRLPGEILDKEWVKQSFLAEVKMNLLITNLSSDVYENVSPSPRLVYQPNCPFYTHSADQIAERNIENENEEDYEISYLPLPEKLPGYPDIYKAIGFDKHALTKLREVDIGDEIVTVWHPAPPLSVNNDLSLDSYFQKKTENTLKIRTEKQTGKISGLFNFRDNKGLLSLSVEECRTIALKFLYTLYPNADQYFRISSSNEDEEEETTQYGFHFSIFHRGISTHFGLCHITVNKTTGFITHYSAPDIDVDRLENIDVQPTLSEKEAKSLYLEDLDFELIWNKNYEENQHEYHELIYRVSFPKLNGDIHFINAHSGGKITAKM